MRKIPVMKRMEVLRLYFMGYSYDNIVKKTEVSKGSVVNIIEELKEGRYPEFESVIDLVDELRDLAVEIRKGGLEIPQASLGLRFYGRLQGLGVKPQALNDYIKMCRRISPQGFPVDRFVNIAIRLIKLEGKLGKPYNETLEDLEKELENKSLKLKELSSILESLEKRKISLSSEVKKLDMELSSTKAKLEVLVKGSENLEKLGLDKVCMLSSFIAECGKLGYNTDRLKNLIKLVDEKKLLERQISTLKERHKTLNEELKQLKEATVAKTVEDRQLFIAYEILKNHTTRMSCFYCGRTIIMPVPSIWELKNSMMKKLIYLMRCQYCSYTNQISPQDILANIAWSILMA